MDAVLAREAFWHALGECMNGLTAFDEQVPFEAWYQQELQGMLRASLQVCRMPRGRRSTEGFRVACPTPFRRNAGARRELREVGLAYGVIP